MYQISIAKGTKVLCETGGMITLLDDVINISADRQKDGGFIYSVNGIRYYTCAGMTVFKKISTNHHDVCRHKDGLVVFS